MLGYQADRGAFANSCWMTDETRFPTEVEILVDDVCIGTRRLENDWADSRGVLSWHAQGERRRLEDAGSYGEQIVPPLPSPACAGHHGAGRLYADAARRRPRRPVPVWPPVRALRARAAGAAFLKEKGRGVGPLPVRGRHARNRAHGRRLMHPCRMFRPAMPGGAGGVVAGHLRLQPRRHAGLSRAGRPRLDRRRRRCYNANVVS